MLVLRKRVVQRKFKLSSHALSIIMEESFGAEAFHFPPNIGGGQAMVIAYILINYLC